MTDNNAPGLLHSLANLGAAGVHEGQQAVDHAFAAARSRKIADERRWPSPGTRHGSSTASQRDR
jgi:hypothetical protein